jgi:prepilin-type N-terminal cleavage/methylation domain-containing protein
MQTTVHKHHYDGSSRRGFTLIEVLIVLVIISILMALLFPAFQRAQENGRQASCQSNLKQIYLAVTQYKNDEREYPATLAVLLPPTTGPDAKSLYKLGPSFTHIGGSANSGDEKYECGTGTDDNACPNPDGTGTLAASVLTCPNDDLDDVLRSSYGDISTSLDTKYPDEDDDDGYFLSRYMWNYWGYDEEGRAFKTADDAGKFIDTNDDRKEKLLRKADKNEDFDPLTNPVKNSLSNRYAPTNTVITHCVFHRPQTANNVTSPDLLYNSDSDPRNARDIVLRLDGSTRAYNVSEFATATSSNPSKWQTQDFD